MTLAASAEKAGWIIKKLENHGHRTFIVGGAVRDAMTGKVPDDIDLLTQADPGDVESLFAADGVKRVGKKMEVCLVGDIQIASPRNLQGVFPEDDLARRDFTINAMACDIREKNIIDPFSGKKDLEKGLIRFTQDPEERIKEDPVRMIRACRFLAMLNGTLESGSKATIEKMAHLLEHDAAKERIRSEVLKAMVVDRPSLFFQALYETGQLAFIFPSLDRCYGLSGGPYHGETVFEHCMLVGDALPASMPNLRLAGYLHDTGKFDAARIKDGNLTFPGHENDYQHSIDDLRALRFSEDELAYVTSLILAHMHPLTDESTPKAVRRLLAKLERLNLDFRDFMRMRIADRKGNLAKPPYTVDEIRVRLKKMAEQANPDYAFRVDDLKISGRKIMEILKIEPGPAVGDIKEQLFERVLDNPELNTKKDLEALCLQLKIKK